MASSAQSLSHRRRRGACPQTVTAKIQGDQPVSLREAGARLAAPAAGTAMRRGEGIGRPRGFPVSTTWAGSGTAADPVRLHAVLPGAARARVHHRTRHPAALRRECNQVAQSAARCRPLPGARSALLESRAGPLSAGRVLRRRAPARRLGGQGRPRGGAASFPPERSAGGLALRFEGDLGLRFRWPTSWPAPPSGVRRLVWLSRGL